MTRGSGRRTGGARRRGRGAVAGGGEWVARRAGRWTQAGHGLGAKDSRAGRRAQRVPSPDAPESVTRPLPPPARGRPSGGSSILAAECGRSAKCDQGGTHKGRGADAGVALHPEPRPLPSLSPAVLPPPPASRAAPLPECAGALTSELTAQHASHPLRQRLPPHNPRKGSCL